MEQGRKEVLIKYLYPTVEIAEFMFGDLYVELSAIIPKKLCFSKDNCNSTIRKNNYIIVENMIKEFVNKNYNYKKKISSFLSYNNFENAIKNIMVGYVFYITSHINKNTGADVFADSRSVCYSRFSILDGYYGLGSVITHD